MPDDLAHGVSPWFPHAAVGGRVLGYAFAWSALIHSALVVMPLPVGSLLAAVPPGAATRLTGMLVTDRTEPAEVAAVPAAPLAIAAGAVHSPAESPATVASPAPVVSPREPPASRAASDKPRQPVRYGIRVEPMIDSARLGELQDRELNEFLREVDRPAVVNGALRVQYPGVALAESREDTVVIWAVVDASGVVEEIHLVEGTPEFYERVAAAVKAHRFYPAIDAGTPVRFPIALEFRFRIEGATAASSESAAPNVAR